MRIYSGFRINPEEHTLSPILVTVARYDDESGAFIGIDHLPHIVKHSPTGLAWGYGGSGPADLALSILADHFGEGAGHELLKRQDLKCLRFYQAFKKDFVIKWEDCFMVSSKAVQNWIFTQIAEHETTPLSA